LSYQEGEEAVKVHELMVYDGNEYVSYGLYQRNGGAEAAMTRLGKLMPHLRYAHYCVTAREVR
jgi:hypothetical protein